MLCHRCLAIVLLTATVYLHHHTVSWKVLMLMRPFPCSRYAQDTDSVSDKGTKNVDKASIQNQFAFALSCLFQLSRVHHHNGSSNISLSSHLYLGVWHSPVHPLDGEACQVSGNEDETQLGLKISQSW